MNTKILYLAIGVALVAALGYWLMPEPARLEVNPEDSPAGAYRVAEPAYSRLVTAAQAGNCDAAYKLGRHHIFFSLNTKEAIRWYRLAAKCPNANAKGELVGILMHFGTADAEVDKLLLEIEQLDPEAAEGERAAVHSVRSLRGSASQ